MFFVILVFITFFSRLWGGVESVVVPSNPLGVFVSASWSTVEASDSLIASGALLFEKITPVDTLYFSQWSEYAIISEWNNISISLEKWEFIAEVNSLNYTYQIEHSFFWIQNISPGRIYINTLDIRNYAVFSFNSIVEMHLRNGESMDTLTKIFLYPRMHLSFNGLRAKFLSNADLVRISSVFSLDFFDNHLSTDSANYLVLLENLWLDSGDFLKQYLDFDIQEEAKDAKKLKDIRSMNVWEFPGINFLEKYVYIFLNESKKKAYYKNTAFEELVRLTKSDQTEASLISDLKNNLERISSYPEDYNDFLSIIDYYYDLVLSEKWQESLYVKINFHNLILSLSGTGFDVASEKDLFLNWLYDVYDMEADFSYSDLTFFVDWYVERVWIVSWNIDDKTKQDLDYFSFFLSELFISKFSSNTDSLKEFATNDNLASILKIMSHYISLDDVIYSSGSDKRSVTWIYVHLDVLKKMEDFIRNGLFKEERGKNDVLIKSRNFSINVSELALLQKNTQSILDFYKNNKKFLQVWTQKDASIIRDYSILEQSFAEYFAALNDYGSYIYDYDISKTNLFWIKTLGRSDADITLSRSNAISYISSFRWVTTSGIEVEVLDTYYKIKNIFISWKKIDFYLYPFEENKIDTIYINNALKTVSYKLDIVEWIWHEKREVARDEEEKDRYDFKNFFTNTFFTDGVINNAGDFDVAEKWWEVEDKFVVVFKRDRLLSSDWEFSSIDSFLSIDFDDITLTESGQTYDISIQDWALELWGGRESFLARFESDYVLTNDDHYFKAIRLYPYISTLGITQDEMWGNFIQIIWNIDLVKLESELIEFITTYNNIKYVYGAIDRNLDISDIDTSYRISTKKVNFRFDYQWDFVSILLYGDTIENISVWWTSLQKDVNYRAIEDILKTIKK